MAKNVTLEGLRRDIAHSIHGRKLGLDSNDQLVGPKGVRVPIEGFTSGASTIPSTATLTLTNYGLSVVGTVASSGTSASSTAGHQLPAPDVGVRKTLFNASTALMTVSTVTGASYFMSTGSAGSTYQYVSLWGKGASVDLVGLSTSLWGVLGNPMTTVSTNVSFV